MTYGKLREIKTTGWTTNCVIDDAINNAIFCFGRGKWSNQPVSEYELSKIKEWAAKEGCLNIFTAQYEFQEVAA